MVVRFAYTSMKTKHIYCSRIAGRFVVEKEALLDDTESLVWEGKVVRVDKASNGNSLLPHLDFILIRDRKEQNGHQYKCTLDCEGRTTAPASNVRSVSKRDPRILMIQGIGLQVSAGSNIQTAVAKLAQYRANTIRDTTGLCQCSGGSGYCTGCDVIPVFQDRRRVKGDDGVDGQNGEKPIVPLFRGKDGRPGQGLICVRSRTAGEVDKQYRSRYQLELVDFDLEDEGADGIFEPGEHLFIRRIRIKNSGK